MYILEMSTKYSVAEARARLPKILDENELGNEIELTRRGKPVAMLVSVEEYKRLSNGQKSFADAYESYRTRFEGLEQADLEELRDQSSGRAGAF